MTINFQAKPTTHFHRRPALLILTIALAACVLMVGCAPALASIPATGQADGFQVHEYALIEQSTDNPNHARFAERAPAAVAAARAGLHLPGSAAALQNAELQQANSVLAPFGYHLAPNLTPPFSAYTLYSGEDELQSDIAQFWPVSLSGSQPASADFLLPFVTVDGERLAASTQGIRPWNNQGSIQQGAPLAYANTGKVPSSDVYSPALIPDLPVAQAKVSAPNQVVVHGRSVIVDGIDLNKISAAEDVFNWHIVDGKPFYFYTRNGIVHLNYAGKDLPYTYDSVVHGNQGDTAIFNPGQNEHMIWFYALRDGLWYYIEAGNFGQ